MKRFILVCLLVIVLLASCTIPDTSITIPVDQRTQSIVHEVKTGYENIKCFYIPNYPASLSCVEVGQ